MRSEFRRVTVEQAVELIIDHRGRTPKKLGGDFTAHGVQVISAKNVYGSRLHADENQRFVPPEMARRWMPNALRPGDVLLTSEAPLGQAAYLNDNATFCLGQRLFGLRARPDVAHDRFLYYSLISPIVQTRLHGRASGTTAQGIKQAELRQVELDLPPLGEQERIASVLGALDDKIDSNRRLCLVLTGVMENLFRRARRTAKNEKTLGSACILVKRGISPKYAEDEGLAVINQRCIRGGTVDFILTRRHDVQARRVPEERLLRPGDVLVNSTGVGTLGRVAPVRWLPGEATTDSHVTIVRPNPEVVEPSYAALELLTRQDELAELGQGSTGQTELGRARLEAFPIRIAEPQQQNELASVAAPVGRKIATLEQETLALAEIRDALLPKLVAGHIRVPSTDEQAVTRDQNDEFAA